ncbi:hypothetical protein [Streptococcus parauberis]|uniref:hypothetical protein n=1 Tax=Streptococcus parauberis TaxID=1348 RepID=UPI0005A0ED58|nr:hypothetical protein [Streptococcus parauberis]QBX17860.1 hypothetical protein Javan383_0015 [Streptococcus phage Javan383]UWM90183.1 hypothetical protein N2A94_06695 [Streptococcus parauberis]
MRYELFYLETEVPTGQKDQLGNDIMQKVLSATAYAGRFTEWTADDVNIYGRDLTSGTRKMLCNRITPKQAKNAVRVQIDGKYYQIKSVKDLGRWRLLILNGYRL